ncbi:MAG TPA: hypothetical protein VFA62_05915 [Acidimicrobiia bacterium]|nr:hypothetical protein [Acidimicrobiia bacterium]
MRRRTVEEIAETPIGEATAGDLARLGRFYRDVLGEQRCEATRPFAQLLGPDERLGDVVVSPVVQIAAHDPLIVSTELRSRRY